MPSLRTRLLVKRIVVLKRQKRLNKQTRVLAAQWAPINSKRLYTAYTQGAYIYLGPPNP